MATRSVSGIYAIVNLTNGDRYVGSSAHLQQRKSAHLTQLRRNTHGNPHLQAAWNKYGEQSFEFVILEYVSTVFLLDIEQKYLDATRNEYNIATVAWAPNLGKPLSPETRAKQSAALKGRAISKEQREHIRDGLMGHQVSAETRAKISDSKKGKKRKTPYPKRTESQRAIYAANRRGKPHSEETKAKMRSSHMGHPVSVETRAKLSAAHTGRKMPDSVKAKVSASKKNTPVSIETRAKLSAAMKLIWQQRRRDKEVA